ncbi:MAG: hypothetical protein PSN46_00070 [Gammaproteobacteria bacterium]|nr:hypothetical protein [Gammaproteobacteria bacterium]
MFGLDAYSLSVFWPSMFGVALITAAMIWGAVKMVQLTMQEPEEK